MTALDEDDVVFGVPGCAEFGDAVEDPGCFGAWRWGFDGVGSGAIVFPTGERRGHWVSGSSGGWRCSLC